MAASEYVVASRYPAHYIETVAGDKPTSALSTGDRYTDLDGLTSEWNGAAWVSLPASGGAVTPAAIGAALTQPAGGMSAIPDLRTLLAALTLHEDWNDDDDATGVLMGLGVTQDGSTVRIETGIGVIADSVVNDGFRAYMFEQATGNLDITDLFSPAHETLDRVDLVIGRITDPATGAAAAQVVEGTPGTLQNEVWTFTQTGSPGGGTVTLAADGDPMGVLAWDANEAAIQSYFDTYVGGDPGTIWTIAGNAASFTATFIQVPGANQPVVFSLETNSLTGGSSPSVTVGVTQEAQAGAPTPELPSYALLLGKLTIQAGETDPADWTLDVSEVLHLSLSPQQVGLTGQARIYRVGQAMQTEGEDFFILAEETVNIVAGEVIRLSSTGDELTPQIEIESGAIGFLGKAPTVAAAAAYSIDPADIAALLVGLGLMEPSP